MLYVSSNHTAWEVIYVISDLDIIKGFVAALLFWIVWYYKSPHLQKRRDMLLSLLFVTVISIIVGRILANFLPFRIRPLANPDVMGEAASGSPFLQEWSSLPSDHAVMFFAISTSLFLISKPVGLISFIHAIIVISAPRFLVGIHYISDLIVGGILGILLSFLLMPRIESCIPTIRKLYNPPNIILYPFLVIATFNFATMFNGIRQFGSISKCFIQYC